MEIKYNLFNQEIKVNLFKMKPQKGILVESVPAAARGIQAKPKEVKPAAQGIQAKSKEVKPAAVQPAELKQPDIITAEQPAEDVPEKQETLPEGFLDMSASGLLKGFIYSEIYGLPKSKRRGR